MAIGDKKPVLLQEDIGQEGGVPPYLHASQHASDGDDPITPDMIDALALKGTAITSDVDLLTLEKGVFFYEGTVPSGKNYPAVLVGTYQRCNISVTFPSGTITAGYREVTLRTSYGRIFFNSQGYSSWTGWRELATTGYAVNRAGDTMAGNLGLAKVTNGRSELEKDHSATEDLGFKIRDFDADGNYLVLNLYAKQQAFQLYQNGGFKTILHTGNKPSGSYTGNGDATARTIDVGGIGGAVLIQGGGCSTIVFAGGGIGKNGVDDVIYGFAEEKARFVNGQIRLATTAALLNSSGVPYTYQVL